MPGIIADDEIELIIEDYGGGGGGVRPPARDGGGDDDEGKTRPHSQPLPRRYYTAVALAIVSILIFFMVLVSVFILRRNSADWVPAHIPAILWANTAVLLASSGTLEWARRRLALGDVRRFRALWAVTTGLGVLFVAGQVWAWKQLVSQGIFIASNTGSSFFYVFTGLHGLHVMGGLGVLLFVLTRNFSRARITQPVAAEVAGIYWHFMSALWVFLLALLYIGK